MEQIELQRAIEAILFAAGERIEVSRLSMVLEVDPDEIIAAADALADEIAANLETLVGTTEEEAPKVEPRHPVSDTTTKFANLQFGRNYDIKNT